MRTSLILLGLLAAVPLTACGKSGDEKLAKRVEDAADNRAGALDNQADMLKQRADQVRKTGEQRSDAIDAANLNTQGLSNEQKDAIVANQAAAVR